MGMILSETDIKNELETLPGWAYKNDKISRELEFVSFPKLMEFVDGLAKHFEETQHHADMHIYYTKIVFELQTFDEGSKVTEKDIETAREINRRLESFDGVKQ